MQVTWLVLSNQSGLFLHSIVTICSNWFLTSAYGFGWEIFNKLKEKRVCFFGQKIPFNGWRNYLIYIRNLSKEMCLTNLNFLRKIFTPELLRGKALQPLLLSKAHFSRQIWFLLNLFSSFFILRRRPVKTIFARVSFALLLLLRTTSYLFLARRL